MYSLGTRKLENSNNSSEINDVIVLKERCGSSLWPLNLSFFVHCAHDHLTSCIKVSLKWCKLKKSCRIGKFWAIDTFKYDIQGCVLCKRKIFSKAQIGCLAV